VSYLDDMVAHAGTMKEWFNEPGTKMYFNWVEERFLEQQKQLRVETDLPKIYRLQGSLDTLIKESGLPGLINSELKRKNDAVTVGKKTR